MKNGLKGSMKIYTLLKHYWCMFGIYIKKFRHFYTRKWPRILKVGQKGKNVQNDYKAFIKHI